MLYAAIDIHKHAFQAAVLDAEGGEVVEARFSADRESLGRWAEEWQGRVAAVAIEATTGWRWVWRELSARGFDVRLAEPVQARALLGRRRSAKTDRLDARWLARLLAKEMLPESWIPPEEIQRLRDRTRLRKALAEDRAAGHSGCTPSFLHEGWPCAKSRLLTPEGHALGRRAEAERARTAAGRLAACDRSRRSRCSWTRSTASCAASPAATRAARRCSRSTGSARSSPATCSPRSARPAASAAPSRSPAWPGSTRSSTSQARRAVAASSPRPARRSCAGRWSKRPCTPIGATRPDLELYRRRARRVATATVAQADASRARSASAPTTSCASSSSPPPDTAVEA